MKKTRKKTDAELCKILNNILAAKGFTASLVPIPSHRKFYRPYIYNVKSNETSENGVINEGTIDEKTN